MPFRHVVWVAKTAATIDILSGGRLVLGVGVGAPPDRQIDGLQNIAPHSVISQRETALFELPGPRGRVMDEALQALDALWTQDSASFSGEYLRFSDIDLRPQPAQRPRPPIYVGGRAEGAIRRAALYADGWFPSQASTEVLAAGLATARSLAAEAGRPEPRAGINLFLSVGGDGDAARAVVQDGLGHRFKTAEGLAESTMAGDPDDVVARIRAYEAAGCSLFDLKVLPHRGDARSARCGCWPTRCCRPSAARTRPGTDQARTARSVAVPPRTISALTAAMTMRTRRRRPPATT